MSHSPSAAALDALASSGVLRRTGIAEFTADSPVFISTLGSDVVNNNSTANTIADVTGLSFSVTSGVKYRFRFWIVYSAAATTTGSRWSINGPTAEVFFRTEHPQGTIGSRVFTDGLSAYDTPSDAVSNSAATSGNIAVIEGTIIPSANGNVIARFASEVSSSAITAKAGHSYVAWQVID